MSIDVPDEAAIRKARKEHDLLVGEIAERLIDMYPQPISLVTDVLITLDVLGYKVVKS